MYIMEVEIYPDVDRWLNQVKQFDLDIYAEIVALIDAVQSLGRNLGDPESHPVVTSNNDMHALRRTPPSATTPFADGPPVMRILYAYCRRTSGETVAVMPIGGDKTIDGNRWYPPNIAEAERRLLIYSGQHKLTPLRKRH
jgi:hypothetical protein